MANFLKKVNPIYLYLGLGLLVLYLFKDQLKFNVIEGNFFSSSSDDDNDDSSDDSNDDSDAIKRFKKERKGLLKQLENTTNEKQLSTIVNQLNLINQAVSLLQSNEGGMSSLMHMH
jgi:hypothetical protein